MYTIVTSGLQMIAADSHLQNWFTLDGQQMFTDDGQALQFFFP